MDILTAIQANLLSPAVLFFVLGLIAAVMNLPPYDYTTGNALSTGGSAYVWARNLLANWLYHAQVAFLEPYVMNSKPVWLRVQAGDYEGEIMLAGALRRSIYREYADAVAEGLRAYYTKLRTQKNRPPRPRGFPHHAGGVGGLPGGETGGRARSRKIGAERPG